MFAQRLSAKDLFAVHAMLSFDGLTEGGNGYPILLQSGESYHGMDQLRQKQMTEMMKDSSLVSMLMDSIAANSHMRMLMMQKMR